MFDCYVYNVRRNLPNIFTSTASLSTQRPTPITPPLKICGSAPCDGDLKISKVYTVSRDSFKHVLLKHKNQLK